jgi:amino acid adenylation domain-containing protein
VLLTDARPSAPLPVTDVPIVAIDWDELESMPGEDPPTTASDDDLAYIIYTSGSTGRPKGVMISNRSLSSASVAYEEAYRLSELTCHLQMASFSFDVFTGDLVRSLLAGARLVLCPLETTIDPPQLYDLMVREGVDAAEFVPAVVVPLFEFAEQAGRLLDFMRLIVVSSEAWRTDRYELFRRRSGANTRIINAYGVTEATIDQTWFEPAPAAVLMPGRFMPIGRPLSNSRVYVLGAALDPVAVGVPGELCIGGVSVAQGYLNRAELTAERFVADPFAPEPGGRLYRTGDLARWLPNGSIEFLGRNDRQIKIRGFRIEPAEIETVLERHPLVRAATVVDRRDPDGDARLAAYLEPVDGSDALDPAQLREFVAAQVPAYMVPAAFVTLDALPVTPNGKVDRNALPDPAWDRSAVTREFRAPSTPTEQLLATIWGEVLGIEEVGVNDNFFALGGHSLLGMQVVSRIRLQWPVALPLRAIFDTPTIAGLAAAVDAAPTAEPEPQLVRLDRSRRGLRPAQVGGTTPREGHDAPGS